MSAKNLKKNGGSNWKSLQKKIITKKDDTGSKNDKVKNAATKGPLPRGVPDAILTEADGLTVEERKKYIGLDCEMVGIGAEGKRSALARACLVDYDGVKIYDRFVRPKGFVTDFRTKYSGVRQSDLRMGEACLFEECQADVAKLLKGKILVGHALKNDTAVLMLSHPIHDIRDTAHYRPLMRTIGRDFIKYRPRALRDLAKFHLGETIQDGEHDPGVDARTAMMLYRKYRKEWEKDIKTRSKAARNKVIGGDATDGTTNPTEHKSRERKYKNTGGDDNKSNSSLKKRHSSERDDSAVSNMFGIVQNTNLRGIKDIDGGERTAAAPENTKIKRRKK
jgi:hypothetical protein